MIRAYKYQLDLNKTQKTQFAKFFGCARFVYNFMLEKKIKAYQENKIRLSAFDLCKMLTPMKKQEEFKWLNEVTNESLQQSIRNMDSAFTKFFREKAGFPKFRSKHKKQSCKFILGFKIDFENKKAHFPKIGWCRIFIDRGFIGKIGTATVTKNPAGKYFVSVVVHDEKDPPKKKAITEKTALGIDVGIKHFATFSTGEKIENPKHLDKGQKRLAMLQRRLSKKQKGSKRRDRAKLKVARLHYKIANQRKDFLHKLSSRLIAENQSIVIEDLNIAGMMKNRRLARAIGAASWSEFYRMLAYKAEWNGKNLIKIGRFEPSSKICSCGTINKDLKLSDRQWSCKECGSTHDRDILAAQNIKRFGLQKQNLINQGG